MSKHPIHTTLGTDAMRILERYEIEMGCKNTVLEQALFEMSKGAPKNIDTNAIMTWLEEIEIIKPLLGKKIPEGSILGITGPPMSGKTILACAVLNDFLFHNEKRCVFISGRNKLSWLIPVTNSLGMRLGNFSEKTLDICETNTLNGIFEILQKSKPKILVIDDIEIIRENESNDLDMIFNSSGWKILSEELKKQKTLYVLISEDETISRFCDIVIKMHKSKSSKNPIFIKVVKNIGLVPSDLFRLEMNGHVRIVPLIKMEEKTQQHHEQNASGSPESLKKIANQISEQTDHNGVGSKPELAHSRARTFEPVIIYKNETKLTKKGVSTEALQKEKPLTLITATQTNIKEKQSMEPIKEIRLTDIQREAMAKAGINLNSINILRMVILSPDVTQAEISRKLKINQPLVSRILSGFVVDKILEKTKNIGRKIPIKPNMKEIMQKFALLIENGLLPTSSLTREEPTNITDIDKNLPKKH